MNARVMDEVDKTFVATESGIDPEGLRRMVAFHADGLLEAQIESAAAHARAHLDGDPDDAYDWARLAARLARGAK